MQQDMHYYGTYAIARAAGLAVKDARILAYAAQYVDDATANDSEVHKDGGMFHATATAHTNSEAIANAAVDHIEQRKVWVPFHFFPGNQGETLSQRLKCRKDSDLAREMVDNHIRHAVMVKDEYGLALMGIMAHVYADTFSHHGFSGVSSRGNEVDASSFDFDVKDKAVEAYIMGKFSSFLKKYTPTFVIKNFRSIASKGADIATGALGHGAVGTYPDRPFLRWRFIFKRDDTDSGWRDNKKAYLEACEKLHQAFGRYAKDAEIIGVPVAFESIKKTVSDIIGLEAAKDKRVEAWVKAIQNGDLFDPQPDEALSFSKHEWEQQAHDFEELDHSSEMKEKDVYKFHQAAIYHRDYTLKQLLPKHGIVVL
ncbi:DUF6765 family protein [Desulfobacter sp.]|uniref:DUF6765 family protein n=1 Tax=Desulfobacter sp. TaxID=2294 RepID=UPI000E9B0DDC|nr:DUF6765 family protein [Desulfobacter sp.]HBT88837.1 hypothetical protein [Desulfobacter sp.]